MTSTVPADSAGLTAVIDVSLFTVSDLAAVVPKSTPVAPVKPVPVMVTEVPPAVDPDDGLTPVTVGADGAVTAAVIATEPSDGFVEAAVQVSVAAVPANEPPCTVESMFRLPAVNVAVPTLPAVKVSGANGVTIGDKKSDSSTVFGRPVPPSVVDVGVTSVPSTAAEIFVTDTPVIPSALAVLLIADGSVADETALTSNFDPTVADDGAVTVRPTDTGCLVNVMIVVATVHE